MCISQLKLIRITIILKLYKRLLDVEQEQRTTTKNIVHLADSAKIEDDSNKETK